MATEVLGDMLVRYRADISDLTSKVSQVKSEMSSVPPVAEKSGSSIFSGFKSGIQGALQFGSQIGMTVFGIKNLADSAIGLGSALLEPNASMEQTTVGFETLLGKGRQTQDFMKELQSFADSTPFEFPQLATDAEHMLAFGFNSKEILPDLTAVGDAMSAMGKSNAEIDQVVTVFGQMKAAGKVNAQDMMQLTSQGIPAWKILADSMHLSVAQVQDLSQKGLLPADASIKRLTTGMEKMFGGGMKAQAQTFNGQLSTLQDKAGAAMRSFTGPLFDMAKQGLGQLGTLVSSQKFQDFAKTMGQDIALAFQKISGVIGPVADGIGKVIGWFQQGSAPAIAVGVALAAIAGGFAAIQIGAFIATIPALVAGFIAWAAASWTAAAGTIAATWPLFAIGAAIVLVVALIILAVKNWGAIAHWLQGVWQVVSSKIGDFFSWLGTQFHKLGDVFGAIGRAIGGIFSWIGDKIHLEILGWQIIFHWIGDQFSKIGSFFHTIIGGIGNAFSGLGSKLHGIWDGIIGIIKGAINTIIGAINHFIDFIDGIQIHIPSIGIGPIQTPAFNWNGLGIPHIPMLAQGGLIQSTGLAFVHQGEAVIPRAATTSSFGGRGGDTHIHVEVGGTEVMHYILNQADSHIKAKYGPYARVA